MLSFFSFIIFIISCRSHFSLRRRHMPLFFSRLHALFISRAILIILLRHFITRRHYSATCHYQSSINGLVISVFTLISSSLTSLCPLPPSLSFHHTGLHTFNATTFFFFSGYSSFSLASRLALLAWSLIMPISSFYYGHAAATVSTTVVCRARQAWRHGSRLPGYYSHSFWSRQLSWSLQFCHLSPSPSHHCHYLRLSISLCGVWGFSILRVIAQIYVIHYAAHCVGSASYRCSPAPVIVLQAIIAIYRYAVRQRCPPRPLPSRIARFSPRSRVASARIFIRAARCRPPRTRLCCARRMRR